MQPKRTSSWRDKGALTDLQKLQFDYAWKWFSFHAEQRTKVFNFMVLAAGILANAIVALVNYKHFGPAAALSFTGAVLSFIFVRLDNRNRDLVHLGEAVLVELERSFIFGTCEIVERSTARFENADARKTEPFGILWRQDQRYLPTEPRTPAQARVNFCQRLWMGQHRLLFPLIGYLLGVGFFAAAVSILIAMP